VAFEIKPAHREPYTAVICARYSHWRKIDKALRTKGVRLAFPPKYWFGNFVNQRLQHRLRGLDQWIQSAAYSVDTASLLEKIGLSTLAQFTSRGTLLYITLVHNVLDETRSQLTTYSHNLGIVQKYKADGRYIKYSYVYRKDYYELACNRNLVVSAYLALQLAYAMHVTMGYDNFAHIFMSAGFRLGIMPELTEFQLNYWADIVRDILSSDDNVRHELIEIEFREWNIGIVDLITAVERGDVAAVEHLLSHHASSNSVGKDGCSVLMTSCLSGNDQLVKILLQAGADATYCNPESSQSVLDYASKSSNPMILDIILSFLRLRDGPLVHFVVEMDCSRRSQMLSSDGEVLHKVLCVIDGSIRGDDDKWLRLATTGTLDGPSKLCTFGIGNKNRFIELHPLVNTTSQSYFIVGALLRKLLEAGLDVPDPSLYGIQVVE
jgi:hypothetical protein